MANFYVEGLDELQAAVSAADAGLDEFVEDCLLTGGNLAKPKIEQSISSHGYFRTGQLLSSIKVKKEQKEDRKCVYVTPDGKRTDGERNGTVAFVLNYGRSNMAGSRYWNAAEEQARKEYEKVVDEKTNLFLKEKGLK